VIGGLSYGELGFVAVLLVLVLLSQVAPRIGESIGALFEGKPASKDDAPPRA
jgi:hypothetical protein